jgi:Protein of unknown function (DUF4435)
MRGANLSENEMVSYLSRTSLPTILVEGSDDRSVYRYLEEKINIESIDILICNGREMLINLFNRRNEFQHIRVVFIADKDMWFFTGIPGSYDSEIIFTDGYSLENDLYIKSLFESLLDQNEVGCFRKLIEELSTWFAFEVDRYKKTGESLCDFHANQICPENSLCNDFKLKIGFIAPPIHLVTSVSHDYSRSLRGKNLFEALLRFLSHSKRESKYSRRNLLELGAKANNPRVDSLVMNIQVKFNEYAEL